MPLKPPRLIATVLWCGTAVALFAALAYAAGLRKSATLDEPLHTASAFAATYLRDYRLDAENPPLWKYWSMIGVRRDAVRVDPADPVWQRATRGGDAQVFATQALYQTSGVDGHAVIDSVRAAMMVLGVLVLAGTAAWTYKLAGSAAAACACLLLALDPTFLGHAAIVKNDVAMTLLMLLLVIGLTSATAALTVRNIVLIALACGAAMSVKFSGVLWPAIAAIVLVARALLPQPWTCARRVLDRRLHRVAAAAATCGVVGVISYAMIWASYGFRYSVAPDPTVRMDLVERASNVRRQQLAARLDREPTTDEIAAHPLPPAARAILTIDRYRLLPEVWSAGVLGLQGAMARHQNYLLGRVKWGGWWYYFPLALLFKTPLATLAALGVAAAVALWLRRRLALSDAARRALGCMAVAVGVYLASAMAQDINHGVRHLLPIIPLLFAAVGITFAAALRRWPRGARWTAGVLAVALAAESLAAFPHYIAFFNRAAAGGPRGGLALLGDSNLDWGQDLPELAQWRRANPGVTLYLCYYGAADPASYGIDYRNLPGGFFLGPPPENVTTPGVVAMSATRLQGLYMSDELRASYTRLQEWPIREVLPGGTIYLFDVPPQEQAAPAAATTTTSTMAK